MVETHWRESLPTLLKNWMMNPLAFNFARVATSELSGNARSYLQLHAITSGLQVQIQDIPMAEGALYVLDKQSTLTNETLWP
jgi:hypothetical protein